MGIVFAEVIFYYQFRNHEQNQDKCPNKNVDSMIMPKSNKGNDYCNR